MEAEIVKNTFSQSWLLSRHFFGRKKFLSLIPVGKLASHLLRIHSGRLVVTIVSLCCPMGPNPGRPGFRGHLTGIEVSLVYSLIFLRKSQTD